MMEGKTKERGKKMEEEKKEQEVITEEVPVVTSKKLLESGAHYGHNKRRWNPKMKSYIATSRHGVYIIDHEQTAKKIEVAYNAIRRVVEDGGRILFVGTKKIAMETVLEEALRSGSFYVTNRWLGGTLTNFKTIRKSIKRLRDIERMEEDGTFDLLPKKEVLLLKREADKLEKNLGGIKEMRRLPNAIFVVDPMLEKNAILEARKLKIPVFGIVDTNCDPDLVDYMIPANDDAIKSVKLIVTLMADAVVEARGGDPILAYLSDEEVREKANTLAEKEEKKEEKGAE